MATTDFHLRLVAGVPLTAAQFDANMKRLYGFPTLAALLADNDRDYNFYVVGATIVTLAEGYRYAVAASSATDHHLITVKGLKLYVLPSDDGSYNLGAFNPAGNDVTDDILVFTRAFEVAQDNTLHIPQKNYYLSRFLENQHLLFVNGHGAKLRFPAGSYGLINKATVSAGGTGLHGRSKTGDQLIAFQSGLVKYLGNVYRPNNTNAPTKSSATLAGEAPGAGTVWTLLRAVEGRDATVPTWTGAGSYTTVSYDPAHESYYTFQPGTYVIARTDSIAYLVAPANAVNHDHETMFGVKLYDINPATEYYPVWDAGTGSIFENLTIDGTAPTGALADGFRLRAPATLRNVTIENFSRHGINAQAQIPQASKTNPDIWGNVNRFYFADVITRYNGDIGCFCRGQDANASLVLGIESYGNGRVGIADHSQLGNTFVGCRTYGNGNGVAAGNTAGESSVVSHGGNWYMAKFLDGDIYGVPQSQLDAYVATIPGTNSAVWRLIGPGDPTPEFPAWQSGKASGFYFYGGGIRSTNTARSTWVGCSCGEDEGGVVMQGGFILNLGGYQPYFNVGGQVLGDDGGTLVVPSLYAATHPSHVWLAKSTHPGNILAFNKVSDSSNSNWFLSFENGNIRLNFINNSSTPFLITDEDTTLNFGTSSPIPYMFCANRGIIIGAGANGRKHDTLTAAPTTGEWARGDVIYNRDPSAGGSVGWICVLAGTPGTWKAFGSIAA